MSWHIEQKKDAENGETPRGDVHSQRIVDIRMGKPGGGEILRHPIMNQIVIEKRTQGIETS